MHAHDDGTPRRGGRRTSPVPRGRARRATCHRERDSPGSAERAAGDAPAVAAPGVSTRDEPAVAGGVARAPQTVSPRPLRPSRRPGGPRPELSGDGTDTPVSGFPGPAPRARRSAGRAARPAQPARGPAPRAGPPAREWAPRSARRLTRGGAGRAARGVAPPGPLQPGIVGALLPCGLRRQHGPRQSRQQGAANGSAGNGSAGNGRPATTTPVWPPRSGCPREHGPASPDRSPASGTVTATARRRDQRRHSPGSRWPSTGYRRPSRARLLAGVAAVAILGVTGVTGTLVVMHQSPGRASVPAATSTAASGTSGQAGVGEAGSARPTPPAPRWSSPVPDRPADAPGQRCPHHRPGLPEADCLLRHRQRGHGANPTVRRNLAGGHHGPATAT